MEDINYVKGDNLIIKYIKSREVYDNIYEIIEVTDDMVIISNNDKIVKLEIDDNRSIIQKQVDFEILEIYNVKLLNNQEVLDWVQSTEIKEEFEYEIDNEILVDKLYNKNERKEDLISDLITDNNSDINIKNAIDLGMELIDMIYNKEDVINIYKLPLKLPDWIIPISNVKKKIYDKIIETPDTFNIIFEDEINREYENKLKASSYNDILQDRIYPFKIDEDSYNLINNKGHFIRICETGCHGYSITYPYEINRLNKENILSINGFLLLNLKNRLFNQSESDIYNLNLTSKLYNNYNNKINLIYDSYLVSKDKKYDLDYNNLNILNLNDKYNDQDIINILKNNIPSVNDLLKLTNIRFMNIEDISKYYKLYGIDFNKIEYDPLLYKILDDNVSKYNQNKKKIKYDIDKAPKELDINIKIKLIKELIFKLKDVKRRNYYIKKLIENFGRESELKENTNYIYNKVNNKILLCKHYKLFIKIEDDEYYDTLINHYCLPAVDGDVCCKVCGEKIFDEEYSTYEGMDSNDKVKKSNEELITEDVMVQLSEEEISIKNMIESVMKSLSVKLYDIDILKLINYLLEINHDKISYNRYGYEVFKNHPRMKEIIKIKNKKDKIKEIKKFKSYIIHINKILSTYIILLLYIQTKNEYIIYKKYHLINLEDISWKNIFYTTNYKSINLNVLNAVDKVIRNLLKTNNRFWKPFEDFYKEDENNFNYQMISILKIYLSPEYDIYSNFEKIINKNHKYLREDWSSYKPLRSNEYVIKVNQDAVENNIVSINKKSKVEELLLINNYTFNVLYEYALTLHGFKKGDNYLSLLLKDLSKIVQPSKLKNIYENGKLISPIDFNKIKKLMIIDLLDEGDYNNKLFVNLNFNNMKIKLLSSLPYRNYNYILKNQYISDNFTNISTERKNILWNTFCINNIGKIEKKIDKNNYINTILVDFNTYYEEKCNKLDINEKNYQLILDYIQYKKIKYYTIPDIYLYENILLKFINNNNIEEQSIINIKEILEEYKTNKNINIKENLVNIFDRLLRLNNEYLDNIKSFLQNAKYTKEQEFRFNKFFKIKNFNIYKSFDVFNKLFENINDIEALKSQIYNLILIISKLKNNNNLSSYYIPYNWKLSDNNYKLFSDYYFNTDLLLHENKIKNQKINYPGFKLYLDDINIYNIINNLKNYNELYNLVGSSNNMFNKQYCNILVKYVYTSILNDLIYNINIIDKEIGEYFFIDIYTHLLEEISDVNWLFQLNKETIDTNIAKQKERERTLVVNTLTEQQNDKREVDKELQKIGNDSMYHLVEKYNLEYKESDESSAYNIEERVNFLKGSFNLLDVDDSMLENMTQEPDSEERYDTTTNEFPNEDDLDNIHDVSYD